VPFAETIEAFEALKKAGKIRHYGVSNLDLADMKEWFRQPGGTACAANQLLFNLTRRGIEFDLLPWLRERKVPVMAYSPIEQARLLRDRKLADFARRHGRTPAQAALAWLLQKEGVIVIPKTGRRDRLKENLGALERPLDAAQLAELDRLFRPPTGPQALDML
jgi:diketogulonate reductase-like aldo/keto reductase